MIVETVGERRVDALDGRDLRRWHAEWSAPLTEGGKPRLAVHVPARARAEFLANPCRERPGSTASAFGWESPLNEFTGTPSVVQMRTLPLSGSVTQTSPCESWTERRLGELTFEMRNEAARPSG